MLKACKMLLKNEVMVHLRMILFHIPCPLGGAVRVNRSHFQAVTTSSGHTSSRKSSGHIRNRSHFQPVTQNLMIS